MSGSLVALGIRLAFVALATFLAIIVWSRTREPAWMLIVIGVVAGYADILHSLLAEFGLAPERDAAFAGVPLLSLILPNLPWLFFSLGFISMIRRRGRR